MKYRQWMGVASWLLCVLFGTLAANAQTERLTTRAVAAGASHGLALRSDGTVWAFGADTIGALGLGSITSTPSPVRIVSLSNVVSIASALGHSLAADTSGRVWAWGNNSSGQLGLGDTNARTTPVQVTGISNALSVASGLRHSLVLLRDGRLMAFGTNVNGQLGNGITNAAQLTPVAVNTLTNVVEVAAGAEHSVALTAAGEVWTWGYAGNKALGDSSTSDTSQPLKVPSSLVTGISTIASGQRHVLVVKTNGQVLSWGQNGAGQLGFAGGPTSTPTLVSTLSGIRKVSAGLNSSAVISTGGEVSIFGANFLVGAAWPNLMSTPQALACEKRMALGAYGNGFLLTIAEDGSVWGRGANDKGQLGEGYQRDSFGSYALDHLLPGFAPNPNPATTRFWRGELANTALSAFVIPVDMERGVAIDRMGDEFYQFPGVQPWLLKTTRPMIYQAYGQTNALLSTNLSQIAVQNPIVAFGREAGGSRLYTGEPYRLGFYAGLFDESLTNNNIIQIAAYARSNFTAGVSNINPVTTWNLTLPRRFGTGSTWAQFASNGFSSEFTTNGLRTRIEFVDGDTNSKPWGIRWIPNSAQSLMSTAVLSAFRIEHLATDTNLLYRVDFLGRAQVGTNMLAAFSTNAAGQWVATPLYTLDFDARPAWRELFIDSPAFLGTALPPEYAGRAASELSGLTMSPTFQTNLVSIGAFTNLDTSPELYSHPLLDDLVASYGSDPLQLANYVQNEIDLSDPLTLDGATQSSLKGIVTSPGVKRSALAVYLEGRGSPTEQCALLIYLLRKAGISAGYAFPTNNNLRLLDSTLSRLWRMNVKGVVDVDGTPVVTNSLVLAGYPWVAAQINGSTVHLFPWLKDTEIVEGGNLYDYCPTNYDNAAKWCRAYALASSDIMSFSSNAASPLAIWKSHIQTMVATNAVDRRVTLDRIGVRAFNRRHLYSSWSEFPKPNYVTNQTQIPVIPTLSESTNSFPFLASLFETVRVEVYRDSIVSSNLILSSGEWLACNLHNRKLLVFNTNATRLALWMAPLRPGTTATGDFTAGVSINAQLKTTTSFTSTTPLKVRMVHTHRSGRYGSLSDLGSYFPLAESRRMTNDATCMVGDIAAVCMAFGRVSQAMLQVHTEDYLRMQRIRSTNSSFVAPIQDLQGTAATLLGMSFLEKVSRHQTEFFPLHKVVSLEAFMSGLGMLGSGGTSSKFQAKLDMLNGISSVLGNGSLRPDTSDELRKVFVNSALLNLTLGSAAEHTTIGTMFADKDAISTVRLLQLAKLRSQTSSIAAPLELNSRNYLTAGGQAQTGYGSTLLKNQDTNMWAQITNSFVGWDGEYTWGIVTPGSVTNATGTYKGMGALLFGLGTQAALIGGNSAVLNGGWGSELPTFNPPPTSSTYNWQLNYDYSGGVSFNYSDYSAPSTMPVFSGISSAVLGGNVDQPATPLTTLQTQYATDIASQLGLTIGSGGVTAQGVTSSAINAGAWSRADSGMKNLGETIYDPVSAVSGAFYIDSTDLELPGPLPLQLRRNYSSLNLSDNQFGYGWKMNFVPNLVLLPSGGSEPLIEAADPDGASVMYRWTNSVWKPIPQDNPNLNNASVYGIGGSANSYNARIERTAAGGTTNFVLMTPEGGKRTYTVLTNFGITVGTNKLDRVRPYLTRWEDHSGNYHSFIYGTDPTANDYGEVKRIESANGNSLSFRYDFYGRISEAFARDGRRVRYEYSDLGDLARVILPDASEWNYTYGTYTYSLNGTNRVDSDHLIVLEAKPDGRVLKNAYDGYRRVVTQAATVGADRIPITNAWFYYDQTNTAGGVTRVLDVFGRTNTYYFTNSLITKTVDQLGRPTIQDWFESSETNKPGYYPRSLERTISPRGLITEYRYDANGNITNSTLTGDLTGAGVTSETATSTAQYSTNNFQPTRVTDSLTNGTALFYEDGGDPWKITRVVKLGAGFNLSTNTVTYTNLTEVVGSGLSVWTNQVFGLTSLEIRAGSATNLTVYNSRGFPIQVTRYPSTADLAVSDPPVTMSLTYNQRGQLTESTDAAGRKSRADFDAMGRMIWKEILDETGAPLSREAWYYNRNGELEWYDGPRSSPEDYVHYDYDGAGRRTETTKWRARAKRNGSGVEAGIGDALYESTFAEYDGYGNLKRTVNPRGVVTTNLFDPVGQLTVSSVLKADGTAVKTELVAYEAGGKPSWQTNALGGVTETRYSSLGLPKYQKTPDGATKEWLYDLSGRVVRERINGNSYWLTTFDDAGLAVQKVFYNAANQPLATNTTHFNTRGAVFRTVDAAGNGFTNWYDGLDRLKIAAGPRLVYTPPTNAPVLPSYNPPPIQQLVVNYFDAAGIWTTNINGNGEWTVTKRDALGRTVYSDKRSNATNVVRVSSFAYLADNRTVVATEGQGTDAITSLTATDNSGNVVLTGVNSSPKIFEFTLNDFDAAGNQVASGRYSNDGIQVTPWQASSTDYDELNRPIANRSKDNAQSTYAYNALGNVTQRVNPGGVLKWVAQYDSAGRTLNEMEIGAGSASVRSNYYAYYPAGTNVAGLLQTVRNQHGVLSTLYYDDWFRVSTRVYSNSLPEHQLTCTYAYDARGLLTNVVEQPTGAGAGPAVSVRKKYDAYSQLLQEQIWIGTERVSTANLNWDSSGRRSLMGLDSFGYRYEWRPDGLLSLAAERTSLEGRYSYNQAGLLTGRRVGLKNHSVTARDGLGRVLGTTTVVSGTTSLSESLSWTGDGLIANHTLVRSDYTNVQSYGYAPLSRRLAQEEGKADGATSWTNVFEYDNGVASGLGVLTRQSLQNGPSWGTGLDAFSRSQQTTNTLIRRRAFGLVNGPKSVFDVELRLNGAKQPVTLVDSTNAAWPTWWETEMDLKPGTNTLDATAFHRAGFVTNSLARTFTAPGSGDRITNIYNAQGELSSRVWVNATNQTIRTQVFVWDAKSRLIGLTERSGTSLTNGYNWTAVYDAFGRRLRTVTTMVVNNTALTSQARTIDQLFDPLVEFLELAVRENGFTTWKLYGPDANGVYGGLNGTGGCDAIAPGAEFFCPIVQDSRGNQLAVYDLGHKILIWFGSRTTGYGFVPGYRAAPLGQGASVDAASAWRGRWSDISGLIWLGARYYDPGAGRFLTADPLGHGGSADLYSFAGGDPVNYFDPDGRFAKTVYKEGLPGAQMLRNGAATLDSFSARTDNSFLGASSDFGSYFLHMLSDAETPSLFVNQGIADYDAGGTRNVINRYNPLRAPFQAVSGLNIMEGPGFGDELSGMDRAVDVLNTIGMVASVGAGAASSLERTVVSAASAAETLPRGFANAGQFGQATAELEMALAKSGITDASIGVRGSSVTGVSFRTGKPFGPASDIDFFVESRQITEGLTTSPNIPGFVHPNKIGASFDPIAEWSQIWSENLGRKVSVGGFQPGTVPVGPVIRP